jgi:hypothetical protein
MLNYYVIFHINVYLINKFHPAHYKFVSNGKRSLVISFITTYRNKYLHVDSKIFPQPGIALLPLFMIKINA